MILLSDEEIEKVVSEYIIRRDYRASVGDRAIAKSQGGKEPKERVLDSFRGIEVVPQVTMAAPI